MTRFLIWLNTGDNAAGVAFIAMAPLLAFVGIGLFGGGA